VGKFGANSQSSGQFLIASDTRANSHQPLKRTHSAPSHTHQQHVYKSIEQENESNNVAATTHAIALQLLPMQTFKTNTMAHGNGVEAGEPGNQPAGSSNFDSNLNDSVSSVDSALNNSVIVDPDACRDLDNPIIFATDNTCDENAQLFSTEILGTFDVITPIPQRMETEEMISARMELLGEIATLVDGDYCDEISCALGENGVDFGSQFDREREDDFDTDKMVSFQLYFEAHHKLFVIITYNSTVCVPQGIYCSLWR
jgi:hypothetical protein